MRPPPLRRRHRPTYLSSAASNSLSSAHYRSSASPLTLSSVFHPPAPAESDDPSTLPRTIAGLINSDRHTNLDSALAAFAPRLTQPVLLRALDLIKPPAAALCLFRWAHRTLRLPLDDRAHCKMLQVLCRSRANLGPAQDFLLSIERESRGAVRLHDRFFNSLIRAYARSGLVRESVELFHRMRAEFGVAPSVFAFNSLLSVLFRRGRTNSARKLFDEMTQTGRDGYGISPDVCTFNILIRGFCLNSMVDEGFRFFRDMSRRWECDPDLLTYNTLLDGLCRAGKVQIAYNMLNGMRNKGPDLTPNVISYTTVIRGYCEKRCISEAVAVFNEMISLGLKPNRVTYNTLIHGLCETQNMDQIKEIMEQSGEDFKPDTCTFNTLMTAHCNMGNVHEAMKVFKRLTELKVKPDSATYSMLIRALCQSDDFNRAEELLDELLEKDVLGRRGGCVPLVAAYNTIFEYLCRNGKAGKAGRVFDQLVKRGTLDVAALKTLILGHCKEGAFCKAYQLVVMMVRRDLVPDEETCQALIDGSLGKGDMVLAWKALQKMMGSGHRPKTATYHSVLAGLLQDACAREASDLVLAMLERKIRQQIDLSTEIVTTLFRSGFNDKAFEITGLLYENGYHVKMEKLVGFLCRGQKFLEAKEMLVFGLHKDQKLDCAEIYSMVIKGLCEIGKGDVAFGLFYEMTDKKVPCVSSCLCELEMALEAEGRHREAVFVSKRNSKASIDPHPAALNKLPSKELRAVV